MDLPRTTARLHVARRRRRIAVLLRTESVGGALLVVGAVAALVLANGPWADSYAALREWRMGPAALGLDLTLAEWTADGLLALFFFLAGLELKVEFTSGELRSVRRAIVPVAAAIGGMAVPALVYLALTAGRPDDMAGWAVPVATDIAFALAVLAIVGRSLPSRVRTFLLTLAVVDDLLAIVIIAVFFAHDVSLVALAGSLVVTAIFAVVLRWRRCPAPLRTLLLIVLAVIAWALMFRSGVHATVAGVLLGFTIPVSRTIPHDGPHTDPTEGGSAAEAPLASRLDEALRPLSAGVAVPLFAFFAAGVSVSGAGGFTAALTSPVTIAIMVALPVGKLLGIVLTTLLVRWLTASPFARAIAVPDLIGLGLLSGIGFTVALLIGQLAFSGNPTLIADSQVGILSASLLAALAGGTILALRSRHHRRSALVQSSGSPTGR